MTETSMSASERTILAQQARLRAEVAIADLESKAARDLADVERAINTEFDAHDARWADLVKDARREIDRIDAELQRRADAAGIPRRIRPKLSYHWSGEGYGARWDAKERQRLRKLAETEVAARLKASTVEVQRRLADMLARIGAHGITSTAAAEVLASMPTIDELRPALTVNDIRRPDELLP
jgi:hypothetical protein